MATAKKTPSSKSPAKASRNAPPPRRKCGCMSVHHWLLEQDPGYRATQTALEHSFTASRRMARAAPAKVYKVNVVVHVMQSPGAGTVTAAQVKSQIDALNRDYRAKNTDRKKAPAVWKGLVADPMIEFQLATKDPAGKPTTGIDFVPTTETAFGQNDSMKDPARGGVAPWNPAKYLNIWVCPLKDGLLGYAQFPGGPPATDGVVIATIAFGTKGTAKAPFNKGRTATHEVGHYFNLRHIWGDTEDCSGSDFVDDTPNAENPNYNKPTFPHISCKNGPNGDMFMNYMDYVDDDTMVMFTPEQVARMHSALDQARTGLWQ